MKKENVLEFTLANSFNLYLQNLHKFQEGLTKLEKKHEDYLEKKKIKLEGNFNLCLNGINSNIKLLELHKMYTDEIKNDITDLFGSIWSEQ